RAAALLDPVAKAAYRERISDLRAELDDAESAADIERAAIVRSQLDQLVAHLAQAAGLGGRSRVFADEAERARVAVRKALTRALAAVHGEDPVLAAAIEARLVTGARCIFHADPAGPAAISP
ncbi:MAG: ATPase, partial [Acidimicrobiia bacterium]